jgi:hypothetical protein
MRRGFAIPAVNVCSSGWQAIPPVRTDSHSVPPADPYGRLSKIGLSPPIGTRVPLRVFSDVQ